MAQDRLLLLPNSTANLNLDNIESTFANAMH